jgi:hypothetical protein
MFTIHSAMAYQLTKIGTISFMLILLIERNQRAFAIQNHSLAKAIQKENPIQARQ